MSIRRSFHSTGWRFYILPAVCLLACSVVTAAAPSPVLIFKEHTNSVNGTAIAPDGRTAATASQDRTIRFWDLTTGKRTSIIRHTDPLSALAFSPDGRILAVADKTPAILLFDVATQQELKHLPKPDGQVVWMTFSPDGHSLATICNHSEEAVLWDVAAGTKRLALKHRNGWVNNVAFSSDSKRAATSGSDQVVRFWDLESGKETAVGKGHDRDVLYVAFAPDGKTVVTGGDDKTLKVWDAQNGKCLATHEGHEGPVRFVAFTPDGRSIVSLSLNDAQIKIWDVGGDGPRSSFAWFRGAATVPAYNSNLSLSPDGHKLLIGKGYEAMVWKLSNGL